MNYSKSKPREIEDITSLINNNSDAILFNISIESIEVYSFLKREYNDSNIIGNHLFQFVFRNFYRLDNAGLIDEFKTEYFNILQEYKKLDKFDFKMVLTRLYAFKNKKGHDAFQFSFVTKMQNMIFENKPIYDKYVAEVFNYKRVHQKEFSIKIDIYSSRLEEINNSYLNILKNKRLIDILTLFDLKCKEAK
jgi:hypothetical protein